MENARIHGWGKKFRIIEQEVSVEDIWWDGNDIAEWGFDDGKESVYKNTKNNRKLLAPVTYDDAGNVIPLSQRFNPESNDIRYSIGGLYTGSAADYAERVPVLDKDGNVTGYRIGNGPSLQKIGTGEGEQVYGWGLYASDVRGVAEGYADQMLDRAYADRGDKIESDMTKVGVAIDGEKYIIPRRSSIDGLSLQDESNGKVDLENGYKLAIESLRDKGFSKDKAIDKLESNYEIAKELNDSDAEKRISDAISFLKNHDISSWEIPLPKDPSAYIYEQTFFTDRAEGDESHLLKWYGKPTASQKKWINDQLVKEGYTSDYWPIPDYMKFQGMRPIDAMIAYCKMSPHKGNGNYDNQDVYDALPPRGNPKGKSEFLARAGIDGVKYPVDSYGTTVKDGDKAGWNYVSFRDDNIRVDHKWVDGVPRYSVTYLGGADLTNEDNARYFKNYIANIEAAPAPRRLADGSPKSALEWFLENMVGKEYEFDIPGIGHRVFRPKVGHIGKLVCHGKGKGIINKPYKGQWVDAVLRGDIKAKDVSGWDHERAVSLPLIDDMLRTFDAVLVDESGVSQAIVFIKKYMGRNGRPNTVVMKIVSDGINIGPVSAHARDLTLSWLTNKKRLVINEDGQLLSRSKDNSANIGPPTAADAENQSAIGTNIVPQSGAEVNGGVRYSVVSEKGAAALGIGRLDDARRMEQSGATRDDIWRKTKWWRAKDGKWRVEIPAPYLASREAMQRLHGRHSVTVGELFPGSDLVKAYPNIAGVRISPDVHGVLGNGDYGAVARDGDTGETYILVPHDRTGSTNPRAQIEFALAQDPVFRKSYQEHRSRVSALEMEDMEGLAAEASAFSGTPAGMFYDNLRTGRGEYEVPSRDFLASVVHELQHLVQQDEGLAKGGDTDDFAPVDIERLASEERAARESGDAELADGIAERISEVEENLLDGSVEVDGEYYEDAYDAYMSLAGEVEARNVETRIGMSPAERAATPPWETEDVAEDRQIVRYSVGGEGADAAVRLSSSPLDIDGEGVAGLFQRIEDMDRAMGRGADVYAAIIAQNDKALRSALAGKARAEGRAEALKAAQGRKLEKTR